MPTLFLKRMKIWQRENGKFVDFSDPTQVWRRPGKKRLRISTNDLYCQKLESLTYILTADSIRLRWLLFTQLSLKVEPSESKTASTKPSFAWNSHSRSFQVNHFAINHRPTRVTYRYIILLALLKFLDKQPSLKSPKKCSCRQPHSHLRPAPRGTPGNVRMHLIYRNSNHWPTFLSLIVWVYLYPNLCSGLQKRIFSAPECVLAVQGRSRSSKVDDFGTNRSAYATSY